MHGCMWYGHVYIQRIHTDTCSVASDDTSSKDTSSKDTSSKDTSSKDI